MDMRHRLLLLDPEPTDVERGALQMADIDDVVQLLGLALKPLVITALDSYADVERRAALIALERVK